MSQLSVSLSIMSYARSAPSVTFCLHALPTLLSISTLKCDPAQDSEPQHGVCNKNSDRNHLGEHKECLNGENAPPSIKRKAKTSDNQLEEVLKSLERRRKKLPMESIPDLPTFQSSVYTQQNSSIKRAAGVEDELPSLPKLLCSCLLHKKHQAEERTSDVILSTVSHTHEPRQMFPKDISKSPCILSQTTEKRKETRKLDTCKEPLHQTVSSSRNLRADFFPLDAVRSRTVVSEDMTNTNYMPCAGGLMRIRNQEASEPLPEQLKDGCFDGSGSEKRVYQNIGRGESSMASRQGEKKDFCLQSYASGKVLSSSKTIFAESTINKSRLGEQDLDTELAKSTAASFSDGLSELLTSCPMCQTKFSEGLTQCDIDGHLAACLSVSADDIVW